MPSNFVNYYNSQQDLWEEQKLSMDEMCYLSYVYGCSTAVNCVCLEKKHRITDEWEFDECVICGRIYNVSIEDNE